MAVMKTTLFLDAQDHFSDKYCQLPVFFLRALNNDTAQEPIKGQSSLLIEDQCIWYCNLESLHNCIYQVYT